MKTLNNEKIIKFCAIWKPKLYENRFDDKGYYDYMIPNLNNAIENYQNCKNLFDLYNNKVNQCYDPSCNSLLKMFLELEGLNNEPPKDVIIMQECLKDLLNWYERQNNE